MAVDPDLQLHLSFLDLADGDRANLAELGPLLEKHADGFVAAFYRHLLSFDETRALLASPEVKDRLLLKQREYLLSLARPSLDADYAAQRIAIGRTHVRVGLEPRWYLGAYALYMRLLVPVILEHWQRDLPAAERMIVSLHKVLMLDAELAMQSYVARREERLAFLNRELADASRELEKRWEDEQERSREATARARAAEDLASLATVVAGLAHEIGTPMGVVQGHAELLESSVHDERGKRRLQTIREQIERISNIIQTLLNMARPGGREHGPVDLVAVVRHTLAFLAEKLRAHRVQASLELPARAIVAGNADKLQQLFINLVMNAIDAMAGGGSLSIVLRALGAEALEITVRDTGHGMTPETLARAFDPFFSTKEPGRGSGLGLVVAEQIARDHGGTIEVESSPQGTVFTLRLPGRVELQSEAPLKSGA